MKPEDSYFLIIHPDNATELFRLATPKERWKVKYRAERLARKGKFVPEAFFEKGVINGLRFIENDLN